ncbi:MAG: flagellar biosynthesis anti-sigma factor FlgM [Phycisphaerales bacterium]|nr:flagellar biosynthesis anti-sigma factor FlgM [Phycisphaerales bacterium]
MSDRARYLARVQREPGVRHELVERVRTEIDAGRYETDERIDIAVKRLGLDILA